MQSAVGGLSDEGVELKNWGRIQLYQKEGSDPVFAFFKSLAVMYQGTVYSKQRLTASTEPVTVPRLASIKPPSFTDVSPASEVSVVPLVVQVIFEPFTAALSLAKSNSTLVPAVASQ